MQGQIEATNKSQSGKTLGVKIGETWYTSKSWELEGMVGQTIDFEPSSSVFNGKTMWWINDYGVSNAPPTADQAMAQAMANQPPPMGSPAPPPQQFPQGDRVNAASTAQKDRDASIVAQALTKACTGPGDTVEDVWERYVGFYSRYQAWNPADDSLPY